MESRSVRPLTAHQKGLLIKEVALRNKVDFDLDHVLVVWAAQFRSKSFDKLLKTKCRPGQSSAEYFVLTFLLEWCVHLTMHEAGEICGITNTTVCNRRAATNNQIGENFLATEALYEVFKTLGLITPQTEEQYRKERERKSRRPRRRFQFTMSESEWKERKNRAE